MADLPKDAKLEWWILRRPNENQPGDGSYINWRAQWPLEFMQCDHDPCIDDLTKSWFGPFHCKDCADWCATIGLHENHAYDFLHGTGYLF